MVRSGWDLLGCSSVSDVLVTSLRRSGLAPVIRFDDKHLGIVNEMDELEKFAAPDGVALDDLCFCDMLPPISPSVSPTPLELPASS
jgi:hypothetical protein